MYSRPTELCLHACTTTATLYCVFCPPRLIPASGERNVLDLMFLFLPQSDYLCKHDLGGAGWVIGEQSMRALQESTFSIANEPQSAYRTGTLIGLTCGPDF